MKPKNVNIDDIVFNDVKRNDYGGKSVPVTYNGRPFIIQTPMMVCPFGISKREDDETGRVKYYIEVSFRDLDTNKAIEHFYKFLEKADTHLVKNGAENAKKWFGKNHSEEVLDSALLQRQIRFPIDKETGEISQKYSPTFKMRIPFYNERFTADVYDDAKVKLASEDVEDMLVKRCKVRAILSCSNVWLVGGKFGLQWRMQQLQVQPNKDEIQGFIFQDDDDEINDNGGASASDFYGDNE